MQIPEVEMSATFRPAGSDVVIEAFPDETIAVNLAVGRYYSLDLIAAEILDLLTHGCAVDVVVGELARRYGEDAAVVRPAVVEFTAQLLAEGLISPDGEAGPDATAPRSEGSAGSFSAPTMSVYTDMEELLLLDPVHDVDETGWPVRVDIADPAASDLSGPG